MLSKLRINVICTILFLSIICYGFIYSIKNYSIIEEVKGDNVSASIEDFEEKYNELFQTDQMINIYGGIHKMLGKKEVKNFEVIKDNNDELFLGKEISTLNKQNIEKTLNSVKDIYKKSQEIGAKFLFVQVPYKTHEGIKELENYPKTYRNAEYDLLLEGLDEEDIPFLDLRTIEEATITYKTDHHWTVEASFNATKAVMNKLNELYGLDKAINKDYLAANNYELKTYAKSFLGSIGVKVGEIYTEREDFNVLIPKFPTDLTYKHIVKGEVDKETAGDFKTAFLNEQILNKAVYKNKYNACLQGGHVENIIENKMSSNDMKTLFISHSYGRPMTQYLSLLFKETRYVDPSPGRYNESYIKYMEEYKPDVVVVMYNGEINTTN